MAQQDLAPGVRERWQAVARRLPPGINGLAERMVGRDLLLEASSLGFYGLVSALPLLTLTFTLVGSVAGEDTLRQFAQQAEESGPAGAGQILQQLVENSDTLSWAAIIFTIWPATAYGGGLRRAFMRASDDQETAPALRGRATAIGLVFALPVLVLAGLPLAAVLTSLGDDGLVGTIIGWGLALVVGVSALTAILTALYHAFTPRDLGWRHTLRGAAVTAVVTTLFSIGFIAYLRLGDVEARFGGATIGLVVMLGVYLFVANALLLAGFEVATELEDGGFDQDGTRDRRSTPDQSEDRPGSGSVT